MSKPLWDKGTTSDEQMMRYTARDDHLLDARLLRHDLRATLAHVRGLQRINVLTTEELDAMQKAIETLDEACAEGRFTIGEEHEDGHSAIEAALVETLGDTGKKVHTGRSRNDQVLVALRLYEKHAIEEIVLVAKRAAKALVSLAEREAMTPMPGYTHLQRAVPSSIGLWAAGIAEGIADGIDGMKASLVSIDRCPLGTAAGYGVNLPLDRQGVADELGFAAVLDNPITAQASRGIVEVQLLTACWALMAHVRRFAWDLSLFTTSEFGFVSLEHALTTGSSIMPNKRNPDLVELMRSACGVVQGAIAEIQGMLSLPSGYHRDLQLTKAPLFRGIDETLATVALIPRLVDGMNIDKQAMRNAISPDCFATDRAVELTAGGMPFRDAYRKVADELSTLEQGDPEASLKARTSPGGPGALNLDALVERIEKA